MLLFAAGGENLALYLKSALEDKEKGNAYPFIIYDKLKGAYAGGHEKHTLYGRRYLEKPHAHPQGGRRHSIILSMLKEEWFNTNKSVLKAKLLLPQ